MRPDGSTALRLCGSTAVPLYTLYTFYTLYTIHTIHTFHTFHTLHTGRAGDLASRTQAMRL